MLKMQHVMIIAALVVVYFVFIKPSSREGMYSPFDTADSLLGSAVDPAFNQAGMYDIPDSNAFGTTAEADRRITNYGVRPEYNKNPFPLGYGCGSCDKSGVPNPAPGDSHVCMNGLPSKRMIDAYGGSHHMLPHMCAAGGDKCGAAEPPQLGRFWCRKGCGSPETVGLDIRPNCTRCGN